MLELAEEAKAVEGSGGEGGPDSYWLYVVTRCADDPQLQAPIQNPARFPWREVNAVQLFRTNVKRLTQPAPEPGAST